MTRKHLVLSALAEIDIDDALAFYLAEGSENAALGFIEAFETAIQRIVAYPSAGTPHYSHVLNLAGLRVWPLKRFPYLVFYVEQSEHIDVWRVLHNSRDVSAALVEDAE